MITARPLGSTRQATTTTLLLQRSYRTAVGANARPTLRCGATAAKAIVTPPLTSVRYKSGPYGYTQAKALVFSKFGEPSDVLKCVRSLPSLPPFILILPACPLFSHTPLPIHHIFQGHDYPFYVSIRASTTMIALPPYLPYITESTHTRSRPPSQPTPCSCARSPRPSTQPT